MRAKSELRSSQQRTITAFYEGVREALAYDPESGRLLWKWRPRHHFRSAHAQHSWTARFAGTRAGYRHKHGYICLKLRGRTIKAHRAIWVIMRGEEPLNTDHENGRRADNRFANLSDVTKQENGRNQKRPSTNTSGVIGVSQERRSGRWRAYIKEGERDVSLGYFATKDDAAAARRAAEQRLGYHPNHGRN